MTKPKTMLIGMPTYNGYVPSMMLHSLLLLHKPLPSEFVYMERQRIDHARNHIAKRAIAGGFDYLFLVDDDNPIPPDTLEVFLADNKDIVIAPILARNPVEGKFPLCAYYAEPVKTSVGMVRNYNHIDKFRDKAPLHKIDAGGTGCMLIKRRVLLELAKKYQENIFEFTEVNFKPFKHKGKTIKRRTMSEDVEFCERAVDAGFGLYLDERIRPIHITHPQMVQWQPPLTVTNPSGGK